MDHDDQIEAPEIRPQDRAASGAPTAGWAIGDRFAWDEIHQRILASADEEVSSKLRELFFSGWTAGFAITLTLIGYAVGTAEFPDNRLGAAILYPIGFLYIIIGRYQLYTEDTLSPVKLVLTRMGSIPLLLRLWGVVLFANVSGAALGTLIVARADVLSAEAALAAASFLEHGLELGWWDVFFRAFFAGWLVAGVVWLGAAARDTISRIILVYFVFFVIGATGLFHVVTAASEVFFVLFNGSPSPGLIAILGDYWLPVLLGNTVGGVVAFTAMAYAQAEARVYPEMRLLSWRDVLLSMKGGRPFKTPRPRPEWRDPDAAPDEEP